MRRGSAALLAPAAAALALGACGDDDADAAAAAAEGIAAVVAERLGTDLVDVVVGCPADLDVAEGARFSCSVAVGGSAPIDVPLVVAADGTVELERAVVPTDAAEAYLVAELTGPAGTAIEAECGDSPLLVAAVGEELRCEVTRTDDGTVRPVVVTVLALDGTVRYDVGAATGPSAPAP
jgi:hypothetical protein